VTTSQAATTAPQLVWASTTKRHPEDSGAALDRAEGHRVHEIARVAGDEKLAQAQAAEMGCGITISSSYMVIDKIRAGNLVTVLDAFTLPPQPVHLVYPHARLVAPKIRAFIDFAAPRLKATLDRLSWDSA
jgi:DNA-binding transcriptional LysR family regulator